MLNIVIGYDEREAIAYHVLAHSLLRHASRPIAITPLKLAPLRNAGLYDRSRHPRQSTDFTFSRFLTPFLAQSRISIFMDCDMLCRADICELEDIALAHPYNDVLVVKHPDYVPATDIKFLTQPQSRYPCKNWSSLMVFNGARLPVRNLTPAVINEAEPMDLHQFKWAQSVGELPAAWNHLVGEQPPNPNAKLVHYTIGGPWFPGFERVEFADLWFNEFELMNHCETTRETTRETTHRT